MMKTDSWFTCQLHVMKNEPISFHYLFYGIVMFGLRIESFRRFSYREAGCGKF